MQNLIKLCNEPKVRNLSTFYETAKNLDLTEICDLYKETRRNAPRRMPPNKTYFIDTHKGITSSGDSSNRHEEHLAIALYNSSRKRKHFKLPDRRCLDILDYQTPLKASHEDKKVGKLDLFGVIDQSLPCIIELKVEGQSNNRADTPLRALLEGLAYCAIVEKNITVIAEEASRKFGLSILATPPVLIIMAPEAYWGGYLDHAKSGPWLPELNRIMTGLKKQLNLDIQLLAIKDANFKMGLGGKPPVLIGDCEFLTVQQIADRRLRG
jgi:hypothetical protein